MARAQLYTLLKSTDVHTHTFPHSHSRKITAIHIYPQDHTHTSHTHARIHTHMHTYTHMHALSPRLPVLHPAPTCLTITLPHMPFPPPPPPPHSHTSPWPHSEATPGGHALRPGTFAASHLAHTSHILSHPHSLSPSDSSIQRAVPYQPSGRGGTAGHWVHPGQGTRQTALAVWNHVSPQPPPSQTPTLPSQEQTDRQTHAHTLALGPAPAPRQPCSSLRANAPVCSPSWRWLESDK